eukprot:scaffold46643_cov50-Cyclotella_meneghiniana.AAC.4
MSRVGGRRLNLNRAFSITITMYQHMVQPQRLTQVQWHKLSVLLKCYLLDYSHPTPSFPLQHTECHNK